MKVKTKRKICAIVALIGFLLMYGTAGASDLDVIPFSQIIWQMIIGMVLCFGGLYKGGYLR